MKQGSPQTDESDRRVSKNAASRANVKRVKIVFLTRTHGYGGSEFHLTELLRRLDSSHVDARVVCFAQDPYSGRLESICRACAKVQRLNMPKTLLGLWAFFARLRANVIVFVCGCHGQFPWSAYLAARLYPRRKVFAIEHLTPEALPDQKTSGIIGTLRRVAGWRARHNSKERITSYLSDRTICVSDMVRTRLIAQYGLTPSKLVTIHNGVETSRYYCSDEARKGESASNTPMLLCVARLEHEKGLDTLIRALELVSRQSTRYTCTILGSGRLENDLREMCVWSGIASNVKFEGFVADVRAYLGASDIFVLPSRNEGLPYALLEAMASGLPCIATDVGGVREVISDGADGKIVPSESPDQLAAAILELIANNDLRLNMGKRARAKIESSFNMDASVKRVWALLTA
jgi:glycosyltransferase involved in cell wall biosynthesis